MNNYGRGPALAAELTWVPTALAATWPLTEQPTAMTAVGTNLPLTYAFATDFLDMLIAELDPVNDELERKLGTFTANYQDVYGRHMSVKADLFAETEPDTMAICKDIVFRNVELVLPGRHAFFSPVPPDPVPNGPSTENEQLPGR